MDLANLPDLVIGGVALAPLIVAIVAQAKKLGLPIDYAPYLTGLLSVGGYFAVKLIEIYPWLAQGAEWAATAVVIFMVTSGFYQLQKIAPKGRVR